MRSTAKGLPPENPDTAPVPTNRTLPDGQHVDHWVLSPEERAKGFVRPVRNAYKHVGPPASKYPLLDLTPEQQERYSSFNYVKFEQYPESESTVTGRYWTQAQLDAVNKGCGVVTTMPRAIAETYARDPSYYGKTFCCGCREYLPVGESGEFVWDGTTERVGT